MDILPKNLGTRPRLALEIRPEGAVAARSEDARAVMVAVSQGRYAPGAVMPGLKVGNLLRRAEVVSAVQKALEAVALRERTVTVVVPDAAVRVLLLDFDALPTKLAEALPVVRFRLKKLLPFDADDAVVSFQIMSQERGAVRVLAVAMPQDVVREYEGVVREAGFEPGAVLPSTLASLAGLQEQPEARLLVNAGESGVTTAIVQAGVLLLHRSVELAGDELRMQDEASAALDGVSAGALAEMRGELMLPLVDPENSAAEWALQEPVHGYGVIDEERFVRGVAAADAAKVLAEEIASEAMAMAAREDAERGSAAQQGYAAQPGYAEQGGSVESAVVFSAAEREVAQAVSVAVAYFEDSLRSVPGMVLSAGSMGAKALGELMRESGFSAEEMVVQEAVQPAMLGGGAVSTRVPAAWLAGVRGALRS